jgi:hypothetical protein
LEAAGWTTTLGSFNPVAERVAVKDSAVWARSSVLVTASKVTEGASLGGSSGKADSEEDASKVHFDVSGWFGFGKC